jgi:hypothetical protein
MKLIKLDAIDSTNDFQELFAAKLEITVVTAKIKQKVRADGVSLGLEAGKNLIMSIF